MVVVPLGDEDRSTVILLPIAQTVSLLCNCRAILRMARRLSLSESAVPLTWYAVGTKSIELTHTKEKANQGGGKECRDLKS
jgi:hypothetical protein